MYKNKLAQEFVKDFLDAYKQFNFTEMANIYDELMIMKDEHACSRYYFVQIKENGRVTIPQMYTGITFSNGADVYLNYLEGCEAVSIELYDRKKYDEWFMSLLKQELNLEKISPISENELFLSEKVLNYIKAKEGDILLVTAYDIDIGLVLELFRENDIERFLNIGKAL